MKKAVFIFALLLPMVACAFDFQAIVPSGQTIYFDTVPGGVSVVYPHAGDYSNSWNGYDKPTGALTIPSHVSWQGVSYPVVSVSPAAFYHCTGLTSVTISHGVTSLGNSAFNGCTGIVSVDLPASLTSVGNQAFGGCGSLASVRILAEEPPVTAGGAFYNITLSSCVLYVPCESDSSYASTAPWSGFGSVVTMPCAVTINVGVNNGARGWATGAGTYSYGTLVTLEALPADGFAFICWNDGDTLNPRVLEAASDTTFVAMFFPYVHDTIDLTPTFFRLEVLTSNSNLGLGVGSALIPEGTMVEICALPMEGGRFTGWSDGSNANPRQVTVTGNMSFTAFFDNRVGISTPEFAEWSVSVDGQTLMVTCPEGKNVTVYDTGGRAVDSACAMSSPVLFTLPTGVYVVSVGGAGARKVVVD